MEKIFLDVLNMSLTASIIIVAVIVIRLALKKAPKWVTCLLWGVVGFRLLCPFTIESTLSLIPAKEPIPSDIAMMAKPQIDTGVPAINHAVNPVIIESFSPTPVASANPLQIVSFIATNVWIAGIVVLIIYALISYLRLWKKVRGSFSLSDNIKLNDYIDTPFILGVIRPTIFIPSYIRGDQLTHVIAHEQAHIKRLDYLWKPLGFILLTIHWFNPLVWVAYILLCKDIEIACDEKVISVMEKSDAVSYSQTLLSCSTTRRNILVCPLAFGEVSVKERIKHVLDYRKPAFWIVIISGLAVVALAVCFLTNPKSEKNKVEESQEQFGDNSISGQNIETNDNLVSNELIIDINQAIIDNCSNNFSNNSLYKAASFVRLGQENISDSNTEQIFTIYGTMLYMEASVDEKGIHDAAGEAGPIALTYKRDVVNNSYELMEYWTPRDGGLYAKDIRDKFPESIAEDAIDTQKYIYLKTMDCYAQIVELSGINTNAVIGQLMDLLVQEVGSAGTKNLSEQAMLYQRELIYYGDYTLAYQDKFKDDFDGIRKELLDSVCDEIEAYMTTYNGVVSEIIFENGLNLPSEEITTIASEEEILDYLSSLPDNALDLADKGSFVITYNAIYGMQYFSEFMTMYYSKSPANLVIGQYTTEGDLILSFLQFDGETVKLTVDSRRDNFAGNGAKVYSYCYKTIECDESIETNGDILETIILKEGINIPENETQGDLSDQYFLGSFCMGNMHAKVDRNLAYHEVATKFVESTLLRNRDSISCIIVTNCLTGDVKKYAIWDSSNGFNMIMDAIYNLDIKPGNDDDYRFGKLYQIYLCDEEEVVYQTIVPYQDATIIDYKFYDGTDNGTSNNLLCTVDEVFNQ